MAEEYTTVEKWTGGGEWADVKPKADLWVEAIEELQQLKADAADSVPVVPEATDGHLAEFADGALADSGLATDNVARRVTSPTAGHAAGVNASGDPTDAGFALTDLARLSQANTFAAALKVSLLTAGRVVTAGADGLLQDSAGLTFDGRVLTAARRQPTTTETDRDNSKLGPPANSTGTASVAGELWRDGAGALWHCTVAGTPGTWKQLTPGNVALRASWDLGTAGNWNGGAPLDGYLVYEPSAAMLWEYDTTTAKWLGEREVVAMPTGAGAGSHTFSGSSDWIVMVCPDQRWDWYVERWLIHGICSGTFDGTDQWDLLLRQYNGSFSTLHTKTISADPAGYFTYAETINALAATNLQILSVSVAKTDTPPALTLQCCTLTMRPVRQ